MGLVNQPMGCDSRRECLALHAHKARKGSGGYLILMDAMERLTAKYEPSQPIKVANPMMPT